MKNELEVPLVQASQLFLRVLFSDKFDPANLAAPVEDCSLNSSNQTDKRPLIEIYSPVAISSI